MIGRSRLARGFTLIEILVAVAIFAIVGMLAFGGYSELMRHSERLRESAARTRAIQTAVHRLAQDFASLEPRPVRAQLGDNVEPALVADARNDRIAEFTHSGWSNPAGVPRSTLQRVSYTLEDDRLTRNYWVMLDRTLATEPVRTVLLDGVKSVKLRFMTGQRRFTEQWPALDARRAGPDAARVLPIAVEITIELEDWGTITRLVEVAG
jgi:general secretion pathway protein J